MIAVRISRLKDCGAPLREYLRQSHSHSHTHSLSLGPQLAAVPSAAELYFQLEELEDADKCVTALYLNPDGTVSFGETDGPRVSAVTGTWAQQHATGEFAMSIQRTYRAGNKKRKHTDVGEFHYSTERILTGELCQVGANLAFKGTIQIQDEVFGDEEVGYFSMIDTTEERKQLSEV